MLRSYRVVQDERMLVNLEETGVLSEEDCMVGNTEDACQVFEKCLQPSKYPTEHVWFMAISGAMEAFAMVEVAMGTGNKSVVAAKDIFQAAMLLNTGFIIVAHNHPSGRADPSKHDIEFTERLVKLGELLGIVVLDHLIIGREEFWSWRGCKG